MAQPILFIVLFKKVVLHMLRSKAFRFWLLQFLLSKSFCRKCKWNIEDVSSFL